MKVKILCIAQYHKQVVVEIDAPKKGLPDDVYGSAQGKELRAKIIDLVHEALSNAPIEWIGEDYYRPAKDNEPYYHTDQGVNFEDPEWFDR